MRGCLYSLFLNYIESQQVGGRGYLKERETYMREWSRKLTLFFMVLMGIFLFIPQGEAQAKDIVIVLDPGHGGTEAGATRTWNGKTYKEEVINQKIANYCKAELETYAGVKVYMTRTSVSQRNQDRETRLNIAKAKQADALVSLHINSTGANKQTSTSGAYCCVPSAGKFKTVSAKAARSMASTILKELNSQVGLKNNGYWIDDELGIIVFGQKSNYTAAQAKSWGMTKSAINTKIPSFIVEHCFVNNPNDCKKYINTDAQIRKLGIADAAGIAKYYGLSKKGSQQPSDNNKNNNNNNNTEIKKGVVKVGNALYLYDQNGNPMTGLVKYAGKYYYASSKGKLSTGWKTVDGNKYYFDKKTGAARKKWQTIGKYKYFFSSNTAAMRKKWVTISGKRYYFSKVNGRLLTNYWLKYNNKWYYLDKNGTPYLNCKKVIKGKTYKFNSKGVCTNK